MLKVALKNLGFFYLWGFGFLLALWSNVTGLQVSLGSIGLTRLLGMHSGTERASTLRSWLGKTVPRLHLPAFF